MFVQFFQLRSQGGLAAMKALHKYVRLARFKFDFLESLPVDLRESILVRSIYIKVIHKRAREVLEHLFSIFLNEDTLAKVGQP